MNKLIASAAALTLWGSILQGATLSVVTTTSNSNFGTFVTNSVGEGAIAPLTQNNFTNPFISTINNSPLRD